MSLTWDPKDPDFVADYSVDWAGGANRLAGDTIATSVYTLMTAAGLTIASQSNTTTKATVWLSGGTQGQLARLRNLITTTGGRTWDEEIVLLVEGLTVEDGTGLAAAESFASVETADVYCAQRGLDWSGERWTKERALRRGFDWLNRVPMWKGIRVKGRRQAGAFPRGGVLDGEGWTILSSEIPVEIIHANIELAVFEKANPGGLNPTYVAQDKIRSEQIGPMRVDYAVSADSAEALRPVLTRVDDLIAGLLDNAGGGGSLAGDSGRA